MEKRDPWLLRTPGGPTCSGFSSIRRERKIRMMAQKKELQEQQKKKKGKKKERRWWSSVDVQLHQAQHAVTSNDKVNQWQRELDRRHAIERLRTTTLRSYCGEGAVKEKMIRSNRMKRFTEARKLDQAVARQEQLEKVRKHMLREQLKSMAPLDLRGCAVRGNEGGGGGGRNGGDDAYVYEFHDEGDADYNRETMGHVRKEFPVGFFTLDSEENIQKAFSILAKGKLTIELPALMNYLSRIGDPPLDQNELDEMRHEISKFAIGSRRGKSLVGSLRIDYEKFVIAMRLMGRKQDAEDTKGKAMFKGDSLY